MRQLQRRTVNWESMMVALALVSAMAAHHSRFSSADLHSSTMMRVAAPVLCIDMRL